MTKTCISITGGVDSTYILYKTLSETQDEVTAFHIDFTELTPEVNSVNLEKMSAQNVVNWLKTNVRDFTFENILATSKEDMKYYSTREALKKAENYINSGFDKFLFARAIEDTETGNPTGNMAFFNNLKNIYPSKIYAPLRENNLGKAHAVASLPKALYNITLKCGKCTVENGVMTPCGRCLFKCKYVKLCEDKLNLGWTPDAICDYYMKVARRGQYRGLPGKATNWYV